MSLLSNVASFVQPVLVEARKGTVTPYLEVTRFKGKYRLNGSTVNYSFGGLHNIFDQLFRKTKIWEFEFKNVLLLGMGAGSVIHLISEKYGIRCPITAVEKDEVVIELSEKYFNIENYEFLNVISDDAFRYTSNTKEKYDLIISDLFVEDKVPDIFGSREYLSTLRGISNDRCCVIYNKMTQRSTHKKELAELSDHFESIFPGSVVHKLYTQGSENSLLFYNTLPLIEGEGCRAVDFGRIKANGIPNFNPSFQ
jgi:spermidine synthase